MYNLWYFVAFYTVLLQNLFFLAIFVVLLHDRFLRFTRYYVEKNLAKNSARGEKMTNMRYVWEQGGSVLHQDRERYLSHCRNTQFK